jgi:outer membrane protein assembly factor BamB
MVARGKNLLVNAFKHRVPASLISLSQATGAQTWTAALPGGSRMVPAVSDDGARVYLGTFWAPAWPAFEADLFAFDASTGAQVWMQNLTDSEGALVASPAMANGLLYIGGQCVASPYKCGLHALNATTGTPEWFFNPSKVQQRGGADEHGSNSSTLGRGVITTSTTRVAFSNIRDKLYFVTTAGPQPQPGQNPSPKAYALDAFTGVESWHSLPLTSGSSNCYNPTVALVGDFEIVFVPCPHSLSGGSLLALNAANGQQLWNYSGASVTTGQDRGVYVAPVLSLDNKTLYTANNNNVDALDSMSGKLLWRFTDPAPAGAYVGVGDSRPVLSLDGASLYVSSHCGYMYSLNSATGAVTWTFKHPSGVGCASPMCSLDSPTSLSDDGNTLFASGYCDGPMVQDNNIFAISAGTGTLVWATRA